MGVHDTACRPDTASGVAAREERQLRTFTHSAAGNYALSRALT